MENPNFNLDEFKPEKIYKIITFYKPGDIIVNIFSPCLMDNVAEKPGWYTPYSGTPIENCMLIAKGTPKVDFASDGRKYIFELGAGVIHAYYDQLAANVGLSWLSRTSKVVEVQAKKIIAYNPTKKEVACLDIRFNPEDLQYDG